MNPLQFEIQYECLQNLANGASIPETRSRRAAPEKARPARESETREKNAARFF